MLAGNTGNDRLDGGPCSDALFDGLGSDQAFGGAGDDLFPYNQPQLLGGSGTDSDYLDGGAGVDTLVSEGPGYRIST